MTLFGLKMQYIYASPRQIKIRSKIQITLDCPTPPGVSKDMNKAVPAVRKAASILEVTTELRKMATKIGVNLDQNKLGLFGTYYQELVFWNRQVNLVSERSAGELLERHFIDSLTTLPLLKQGAGFLLDLGSGGGFPGIPLKIMLPEMKVYLVDASRKKTSFLSHIVRILNLTETIVIRERIEDLAAREEFLAKFDTVISRAALKLDQLLVFSSSFLKQGGQLVAMKGPEAQSEIRAAEATAQAVGMSSSFDASPGSAINNSPKKIIIYNRL